MRERLLDLVLGTAGHIDHGKTALVRALTGVDTDRFPAEKQRGITIDLGFAALELGDYHLALVDVPGHERFIRNMLAGASGLDLAMLVVAADDSVMPQTREHLEILRLLGLAGGRGRADQVRPGRPGLARPRRGGCRSLVRGTFPRRRGDRADLGGDGPGARRAQGRASSRCVRGNRPRPGVFRMAIDRSFTVAGHGTVVTGTVASGSVAVGDELEWQPDGRLVRVRGLHRHDRPVERIGRGSRAAINLVGVHHTEVRRGHELAAPGYLEATRILSVEMTGSPDAVRPLRHRGRYKLHLGTAEVSAVLRCWRRTKRARASPSSPSSSSPSPWSRSMASPSSSARRARRPPWEAAASSSRGRAAIAAAITTIARPARPPALGRPCRSPARGPGVPRPLALDRASLAALTGLAVDEVEAAPGGTDGLGRPGRAPDRAEARLSASWRSSPPIWRTGCCAPWAGCTRPVPGIRRSRVPARRGFPDLANDALVAGLIDRLKAQGKVSPILGPSLFAASSPS